MPDNLLYYGDNLDILRRYVADASVDLIYLDPPFKSDHDYNVLFAEQDGTRSAAQIKAFGDTWRWDQASAAAYQEIVERGPARVSQALQAFRTLLGGNDMLAYLSMMAPRLVELHRVLKPKGSIYLHCDPTASHYLKMLMDAIFAPALFRNEIIWERTTGRKSGRQFGRVHDTLFFFSKTDNTNWNPQSTPQTEENVRGHDLVTDDDGTIYRLSDLSGAGQGPARKFGDKTVEPPSGRHWQFDQEGIDQLMHQGRIFFSRGGKPRLKTRLKDLPGVSIRDIWTDIEPINAAAAERLGYPTQKPEALLERIIQASSNEGDTVLDPFCGCGTAVAVAQQLKRRWIGIDITHLAINLIRHRLKDAFGEEVTKQYQVIGEPTSLPDAQVLAEQDRYQFQWWALGLVGARPVEQKKGADKGIDGRIYFHDHESEKTKQVVLSVKSGGVSVRDVRDLRGVIEREQAEIGVLITLEEPTQPMRTETAAAGFYHSPYWHKDHPRLQILTIADLLDGHAIDMPPLRHTSVTFKKGPKAKGKAKRQPEGEFPELG